MARQTGVVRCGVGIIYRSLRLQDASDMDDIASLPGSRVSVEYVEQEPMRRSQSDQLFDRDTMRRSSRRGGELVRASESGQSVSVCRDAVYIRVWH